jgi:hypothetical protein
MAFLNEAKLKSRKDSLLSGCWSWFSSLRSAPEVELNALFPTVLRIFPAAIALVRSDQTDAVLFLQLLVERIAVVSRVADHSFWFGLREPLLDGGYHESCFMRRGAGDVAGDRKTVAVCDRHDFAAFAAASWADSSAPFFAELKLASMKVSDRSILPRSRKSSANFCSTRVSNPERCQDWKRR